MSYLFSTSLGSKEQFGGKNCKYNGWKGVVNKNSGKGRQLLQIMFSWRLKRLSFKSAIAVQFHYTKYLIDILQKQNSIKRFKCGEKNETIR